MLVPEQPWFCHLLAVDAELNYPASEACVLDPPSPPTVRNNSIYLVIIVMVRLDDTCLCLQCGLESYNGHGSITHIML